MGHDRADLLLGDPRSLDPTRHDDEAVNRSMSPLPMRRSAPGWSRITRLSASDETEKASRLGMFALITPVMTSTDGR